MGATESIPSSPPAPIRNDPRGGPDRDPTRVRIASDPSPARADQAAVPQRTITGQNIVCFGKEWSSAPTSNNHVMNELARHNKVLWINSVATRTPSVASARDVKRIFRKLASFFRGTQQVGPSMWVYTPAVLPFPHSPIAQRLNRWIIRRAIGRLRRRLGMNSFQLWSFLPNVAPYVGGSGESISIYYCVDEWSKFSYLDGPRTAAAERDLCEKVDLVFATSQKLVEARSTINPRTYLARHGVDHPLFSAALDPATPVPEDLAAIRGPVVGFYGTIQDWVDLGLIERLARRRPDWSFVLIGPILVDIAHLAGLANIHFLGRKPHSELPKYCKGMAVALIPQKINELTLNMNPLKLREYLSAGLPVVATPLPEAAECAEFCRIGRDDAEFEAAIADAIAADTPDLRRRRSDSMKDQTWQQRVERIGAVVMEQIDSRRIGGAENFQKSGH